jgi:MFS family permease
MERPTSVRWRVLGLLVAFSFLSWFNRVSMSVAGTDRIIDQFGISETAMGWVYTTFLLTYAVCMAPGGWLIDRYGVWLSLVVMGLGLAVFAGLTGAVGFAFASAGLVWGGLMVVRSVMGVCATPMYPAGARAIASWLPLSQRSVANGLLTGAALIGIASTYPGFGLLIDWCDWPAAFLIVGAATSLLALIWAWHAASHPAQHPGVNQAERDLIAGPYGEVLPGTLSAGGLWDWLPLLRNRSLVLLTCSYAAVGYVEYLFFFWVQRYFGKELHFDKTGSRLASSVVMLGTAAGMIFGGGVADRLLRAHGYRLGRAIVPVTGLLLGAILVFAGLVVREPWAIVGCFTLALAAVGATEGPCWATAVELGGRHGGTSAGIFNTGGNIIGLLAPVVTPWVAEDLGLGWFWAILLASFIAVAGAVLWLGIDPQERVAETV